MQVLLPFFWVGVAAAVRAVFVAAVQPVVLFGMLADFPFVVGIDAAHDFGVALACHGADFRGDARGMPDGLTHHSDRGSQYRYPVIFLRNITGTRSCRCVTAHGWRRQA